MRFDKKAFLDLIGEVDCDDVCQEILKKYDFTYDILEGRERDDAVLGQLKRIKADTQIAGTQERSAVWELGWNENLEKFKMSNYDLDSLRPMYYKENIPIRLNGQFVQSKDPLFEYHMQQLIKTYIFKKYFQDYDTIYEFGCGTGYNLVDLAKMYPHKHLYGLDYVPSTLNILELIKEKYGYNIEGSIFDVTAPDYEQEIIDGSAVYTFVCLEQIGKRCNKFIDYLLAKKPSLCVHMEPIVELYDDNNLLDYLAKEFHQKRKYLEGFLPEIKKLEIEKKAEILKIKRFQFGNWNHEGYMLVAWRPRYN